MELLIKNKVLSNLSWILEIPRAYYDLIFTVIELLHTLQT